MLDQIFAMFSYTFIVRAFIVGLVVSLCASLLGVSLVLRKNAMISDGLSHLAFGAFAIAIVLNLAPLPFALPIVILASIFVLRLGNQQKIRGDSAIALLSASALAVGIMAISIKKGVNIDFNAYLFGSILAVSESDLVFSLVLGAIIILLFIFFYHRIFALTFDETFAKATGLNTNLLSTLFAVLCSITIVLGMKLLGSLLISSLIIFPCLTATKLFKTFRSVIFASAFFSISCFTIGLVASYLFDTPTGATIVITNLITFLLAKLSQSFF